MPHSHFRTFTSTNQEEANNGKQKLEKEVRQLKTLLIQEEEKSAKLEEALTAEQDHNTALQDENRNLRTNYAGMKAELKATNEALDAATKEVENRNSRVETGSSRSNIHADATDRERRPYGPREHPAASLKSYPTIRVRNQERPVEDKRKPNGPRPQQPSSYRPPYAEDACEKEELVEQEGDDLFGAG